MRIIIFLLAFPVLLSGGIGGGESSTGSVPVEPTMFTAVSIDGVILIEWQTATEVNNYGFSVERMDGPENNDAQVWAIIGFVKGNGNSTNPINYYFKDIKPGHGIKRYRLKQIDNDGTFKYSNVIEVNLEVIKDYYLGQNYPNPFNPSTVISFSIPVDGQIELKVYNMLGEVVSTLLDAYQPAGKYEITFDASRLSAGVYMYKIQAKNFMNVRKMVVIK